MPGRDTTSPRGVGTFGTHTMAAYTQAMMRRFREDQPVPRSERQWVGPPAFISTNAPLGMEPRWPEGGATFMERQLQRARPSAQDAAMQVTLGAGWQLEGAVTAALDRLVQDLHGRHEATYDMMQRLDTNGDGRLGFEELRGGLRALGVRLDDVEMAAVLRAFDRNLDGRSTY